MRDGEGNNKLGFQQQKSWGFIFSQEIVHMHWNSVDKWNESNSRFTDMYHELFKAMQYAYITVNWVVIGSDNCQAITWHKDEFWPINTLRPRQNDHHFPDDIFKCIFFKEDVWILMRISPNFVSTGAFNIIPALVQRVAWHRPGDKPISESMIVKLLTHIIVTRPQWV